MNLLNLWVGNHPSHPIFSIFNKFYYDNAISFLLFLCFIEIDRKISFASPAVLAVIVLDQNPGGFANKLPAVF